MRTELRADISDLRAEVRTDIVKLGADIADVRSDLRQTELRLEAKIESFKSDILKWMFGTIGLQTLALLGAIVALAKALH